MQTPSKVQIQTAIEVLKMLGERINTDAAHSVMQLAESSQGDNHAARLEARTIEQTSRINNLVTQLETWRDEIKHQRRQCASHHV